MQIITLIKSITLTVVYLIAVVTGIPRPRPSPLDGFSRSLPTFNGTWNGHEYSLRGTIQQVASQLEALHGPRVEGRDAPAVDFPVLNPRNKDQVLCIPVKGQSWTMAGYDNTNANIAYLKWMGPLALWIDKKSCAQIACTDSAVVELCNDNDYRIAPALNYLGTYAQDLVDECSDNPRHPKESGGQEFDTDNYNVIVRGDYCTTPDSPPFVES